MNKTILGVDIGGSHISAGLVDFHTLKMYENSYFRTVLPLDISISVFNKKLIETLSLVLGRAEIQPTGIAVSVPGPFNYEKGIFEIMGVRKFNNLFGFFIKQFILSEFEQFGSRDIGFYNDATSLLKGEIFGRNLMGRVIGLTLGTGFGSSFFEDGKIIKNRDGIPESGFLFDQSFGKSIADEYFSSRWFLSEFEAQSGKKIKNVKTLVDLVRTDSSAGIVFRLFAKNLNNFLNPYLLQFNPDTLLIGGGIARASSLFLPALETAMAKSGINTSIHICQNNDIPAIEGAAILFNETINSPGKKLKKWRKTSQLLAPVKKPQIPHSTYDIYPAYPLPEGEILSEYKFLAQKLVKEKTIILDGYVGVCWEQVISNLGEEFKKLNKNIRCFNVASALKLKDEVLRITDPFMGEANSIFGKRYSGELMDFYDPEKINKLTAEDFDGINIIYGCGASLAGWKGFLVYFDLPKNELQFRSRAGALVNLGMDEPFEPNLMYKRFYFIDWIVLNRHKQKLLPYIDIFVDEQRAKEVVFVSGEHLRTALDSMAHNFFRVRPWFEPGPWGGQWIREKINGLAKEVPNYAWSFELIVPENGLMLQSNELLLECSFDCLMFQNGAQVLGHAHETFKTEFPIRFDFLDTFDGGNLSVQCHPRPEYIKKNFGESFTQDETYYILDAEKDAEVYLGFQENINRIDFRKELEESQQKGKTINIKKYVQTFPSKKHDLFLIPGGTIHASGKNNLVLEISNTPYIFTFKMYDWLRLDLAGKPRPINIEHAFKNLYFDRKGIRIKEEFISHPEVISDDKGCTITHLPTHEHHFYDIRRLEFNKEITLDTANKFYVNMIVEGDSLLLETNNGLSAEFNYAETFVLPAATGKYKLINSGRSPIKVLQAFVKDIIKI